MITVYGEYKTKTGIQRLTTVAVDKSQALSIINTWHRDYHLSWAWIITGKGIREKMTLEHGLWRLTPQPKKNLSWREWYASLSLQEKDILRLKWRTSYANMNPESKARRHARDASYWRKKMDNLTPEERAARLERIRERIQNESPERRQARLAKQREQNKKRCESMTPEQKAAFLSKRRAKYHEQRAMESPEERQTRLAKNRAWYANLPIERIEQYHAKKRAYHKAYCTPEKKAEIAAKKRAKIAAESPEEREERLRRRREQRAAKKMSIPITTKTE